MFQVHCPPEAIKDLHEFSRGLFIWVCFLQGEHNHPCVPIESCLMLHYAKWCCDTLSLCKPVLFIKQHLIGSADYVRM